MASDPDLIGGIALSAPFGLPRASRSEEMEMQATLLENFQVASPAVPVLSDESLMELVCAQDARALDVLFTRYSRLVYSIALRILGDCGEAEEVVQECFLYLYHKALAFEPDRGSAKVWIVQIAYSRARDRKAHLSRRGFYLRTDIDSLELEDTLTAQGDVESEIGARLDFSRLQGAFDDLTEIQRKTIDLYYFEDMGLREISERLQEPLGNVRHHFYRGLERLRKSSLVERLRNHHHHE
ncbi:MAG: sigma-70 family RNA polymerase sigma factor [Terracidiphilus sp.]